MNSSSVQETHRKMSDKEILEAIQDSNHNDEAFKPARAQLGLIRKVFKEEMKALLAGMPSKLLMEARLLADLNRQFYPNSSTFPAQLMQALDGFEQAFKGLLGLIG